MTFKKTLDGRSKLQGSSNLMIMSQWVASHFWPIGTTNTATKSMNICNPVTWHPLSSRYTHAMQRMQPWKQTYVNGEQLTLFRTPAPKLPTPTSALPDPNLTLTSCWSTDSKKPHRCRRLQNKATNIDCMPDIPYTYSGPENVPLIAPSSGRIRSPTRHVILWACPSPHPKQHLERFNLFCTAHGCLQGLIVNPGVPFNYIFKMFLLSNLYLYFIVIVWIQHALWPCRINDFGLFLYF